MTERQLLVNAFRRLKRGERAALATIVSVEGSSYRRPGARMLINENGETTGVLSAGCFERDVCERAARVMSTNRPSLVKYDTTTDEDIVWGLGLGCNGVVHVLIEPVTERVAGLMQLLAKCVDSETSGAIATVFQVDGNIEASLGTAAMLFPDGSIEVRPSRRRSSTISRKQLRLTPPLANITIRRMDRLRSSSKCSSRACVS